MRRGVLPRLVAAALLLAGCASVYDSDAVPAARVSLERQLESCTRQARDQAFPTAVARVACYVDADRAFALAVKLRRADMFTAYAARMTAIAQDVDAHRLGESEAAAGLDRTRRDYYAALDAAYRNDGRSPAGESVATVLALFGQGFANQEAASPGK